MRTTAALVAILFGLTAGLYWASLMDSKGWRGAVRQLVTLLLCVGVVLWALNIYRLVIGPLTLRPVVTQSPPK